MLWINVEDGTPEFDKEVFLQLWSNDFDGICGEVFTNGMYTEKGWVVNAQTKEYTVIAWAEEGE